MYPAEVKTVALFLLNLRGTCIISKSASYLISIIFVCNRQWAAKMMQCLPLFTHHLYIPCLSSCSTVFCALEQILGCTPQLSPFSPLLQFASFAGQQLSHCSALLLSLAFQRKRQSSKSGRRRKRRQCHFPLHAIKDLAVFQCTHLSPDQLTVFIPVFQEISKVKLVKVMFAVKVGLRQFV